MNCSLYKTQHYPQKYNNTEPKLHRNKLKDRAIATLPMNFVGEPDDKDCRNTLFDLGDSAISDNAACGGGDSRCVMRETTHV